MIDSWWREHRPAAPRLFVEELAATLEMLAAMPMIGRRYRRYQDREVRRALMPATRFHAYYVVSKDELVILAVWNASRGYGPPLRDLRR
jgi:plasmid stabilization system protein ParE